MSTRRGMRSYSTRSQTNSGKRQRNPAQESLSDNAAAHNAKRKKKDDDEIPEELSSDEDKQEAFMARLDETNKGLQGFEISVPLFNQFFRELKNGNRQSIQDASETIDRHFADTIADVTDTIADVTNTVTRLTATIASRTATITHLATLEGDTLKQIELGTAQASNDFESLQKRQQIISSHLEPAKHDLESAKHKLKRATISKNLIERLQNAWKGQLNSFIL
jgi:hypothetical protein